MNHDFPYDVCVAGIGPAGAAAALAFAKKGMAVLACGKANVAQRRLGEVLVPAARRVLGALGLDAGGLLEGAHERCHGNVSIWGDSRQSETDFLRDPDGHAWRIDRARLEGDLLALARGVGATTRADTAVTTVRRETRGWRIGLQTGDRHEEISARFLIDATGGSARIARTLGARRRSKESPLVAVAAVVGGSNDGPDGRTFIESAEDGWWYRGRLASGDHAIVFHTDPERVAHGALRSGSAFAEALRRTQLVGSVRFAHVSQPVMLAARGAQLTPVGGEQWLAIGDAASSFDPLASRGLFSALYAALLAIDVVPDSLAGRSGGLVEYAARIRAVHEAYSKQRALHYAAEERWKGSRFWARRGGPPAGAHGVGSGRAL